MSVLDRFQLDGRVALVPGASSGLGVAFAIALAEAGADVSVCARRADRLEETRAKVEALGRRCIAISADVSRVEDCNRAVAETVDRLGSVDVLVNNAGVGTDWGTSGADPDFEAVQAALDTNFFGAYRLTVALLPLLRESEHPRVVNVSSGMGGITEMGGWSPGYRVSKAALNAMTRILSTELADAGVLVNSACPGFVNTDMGSLFGAKKPVEDGAAGIVWLATLPDDGPTGGFFRDGKPIRF
jgi:NAD(P)-dependent dehydrogenase (short-subunit alcohol dehydrogenase family)